MHPKLQVIGAALAFGMAAAAQADVVTDWNTVLLNAIRTGNVNPPAASRAMACVHCAVFDAVNSLDQHPRFESYHVTGTPPRNASQEAAAAASAHRMLVSLFPAQSATFDAALAQSLAGIPNGMRKTKGIQWGVSCANQIIALRANDGATDVVPYAPNGLPGYWVPTPPGNLPALLPNWPYVDPWCMTSGDQFRSDGPPALTSAEYTAAYNEVKDIGSAASLTRTAEQSEIALFWADGAGTVTPPGHWNLIAQDLALAPPSGDQGSDDDDSSDDDSDSNSGGGSHQRDSDDDSADNSLDLVETARLFALLNFGTADAAVVSWDSKYAFDHWRPLTGIRRADEDGNPATDPDVLWSPFIVTPPFPSYTSGHSTFSSTSARILANFFKTDDISFTVTSQHAAQPGLTRSFTSLWAAAEEAGQSRIYGGIHWQYDNLDALAAGAQLGDEVYFNFLRPIGDLNDDDLVNEEDLEILFDSWGPCAGCPADLNDSGRVNGVDVAILMQRWTG